MVSATSNPKITSSSFIANELKVKYKNTGTLGNIGIIITREDTGAEIYNKTKELKADEKGSLNKTYSHKEVKLYLTNNKGITCDKKTLTNQKAEERIITVPEEIIRADIISVNTPIIGIQGENIPATVSFRNTGNTTNTFGVGMTVRDKTGIEIDYPVIAKTLGVGGNVTVSWNLFERIEGTYDIIFSIWKESAPPLSTRLDNTDWLNDTVVISKIKTGEEKKDNLLVAILKYCGFDTAWIEKYYTVVDKLLKPLVDIFGIDIDQDGENDVILFLAGDIKFESAIGARAAQLLEKGIAEWSAEEIYKVFKRDPAAVARASLKFTPEQYNRFIALFTQYGKEPAVLSHVTETIATNIIKTSPKAIPITAFPKATLRVIGVLGALMGFGTWMQWAGKELPEPLSFSVSTAIRSGDCEVMRKALSQLRHFIKVGGESIMGFKWLNPFTLQYFNEMNDMQIAQADLYEIEINRLCPLFTPIPPAKEKEEIVKKPVKGEEPELPEKVAAPLFGYFIIETAPGFMDIHAADTLLGTSPEDGKTTLEVAPAGYILKFTKEGYEDKFITQFIDAGEERTLKVELKPEWEAAPKKKAGEGSLIVESVPEAEIFLGDESTGFSTPHTFSLTPGTYDVTLKAIGFYDDNSLAFIKEEEPCMVKKALKPIPIPEKKFKVIVSSNPPLARIMINGRWTTKLTEDYIILWPGTYTIGVELDGYEPAEAVIELI